MYELKKLCNISLFFKKFSFVFQSSNDYISRRGKFFRFFQNLNV